MKLSDLRKSHSILYIFSGNPQVNWGVDISPLVATTTFSPINITNLFSGNLDTQTFQISWNVANGYLDEYLVVAHTGSISDSRA